MFPLQFCTHNGAGDTLEIMNGTTVGCALDEHLIDINSDVEVVEDNGWVAVKGGQVGERDNDIVVVGVVAESGRIRRTLQLSDSMMRKLLE